MRALREAIVRLSGSLRRKQLEHDVDEELQFHLDKLVEKNIAQGMSLEEAQRSAHISFGGRTRTKDDARDELLSRPFENIAQDLRYGVRVLRKSPAFTIVAVASLALGIGANTAVFSVVNAVLLQSLPYPEADQLVYLGVKEDGEARVSVSSDADVAALSEGLRSIAAVGATNRMNGGVTLTGRGEPQQIPATIVTSGMYRVLGVPPLIGRTSTPEEDVPGSPRVVVLSHQFWTDRFAASTDALGQTLMLDGNLHTIIGVMPPGFSLPNQPNDRLWPSLQLATAQVRAPFYLGVFGRLAPNVTLATAQAELTTLTAAVKQQYPDARSQWSYAASDLRNTVIGESRSTVLILYAAVALVLLMASVNVANLSLARAVTRLPELALRSALGAGRTRIVRQLLTESLLVALLGGLLGLVLAYVGTDFLAKALPGGLPHVREIRIDPWVLAFTGAIAVLVGIAIGLVPALHLPQQKLAAEMQESTRGVAGSGHRRLASGFIVAEFALALTVLISAGLAVNSLMRLQRVDVGIQNDNLLVVRLTLPQGRYSEEAQVDAFFDGLLQRVKQVPGVSNAAVTMAVPPDRLMMTNPYTPEGKQYATGEAVFETEQLLVSPDYFATLGIPVVQGRAFTDADRGGSLPVAIINETFARKHFGGNAIGRWIQTGSPNPNAEKKIVVGVVPDVKYLGVAAAPAPTLYRPYKQSLWWQSMYLVVSGSGDPLAHVGGVRAAINEIDPLIPLQEVKTMQRLIEEGVSQPRYTALLLASFALLGLILAGAGIYGVMSYSVSQRTRETGIRLALGATSTGVLALVIRDGMRLAIVGVTLGILVALATTRLLSSILFEVSPLDPFTFGLTALFLMSVALLACFIPARRASRTDPIAAIRATTG